MKHKQRIDFVSEKTNGTMKVKVEINYIDFLKKVALRRGVKSKDVKFELVFKLPKPIKLTRKPYDMPLIEKKLLRELDLRTAAGAASLISVRSTDVKDIYNNLISNVLIRDSRGGIARGEKKGDNSSQSSSKNFYEVPFSDKMVKMSKGVKKYLANSKQELDMNKPIKQWRPKDFLMYLRKKFKEAYGTESFEFSKIIGGNANRGKMLVVIQSKIIQGFKKFGYSKADVKSYIDWVYDKKAPKTKATITFWFFVSDTLITEWMTELSGKKRAVSRNKFSDMRKKSLKN